jgi:hypothetical protein
MNKTIEKFNINQIAGSAGVTPDTISKLKIKVLLIICLFSGFKAFSQTTEFISKGSFIINMGVTPQTVNNGLRPYGLLYDLFTLHQVPVIWSINPNKVKDGIDFSHNGIDYRGGTFIVQAEFRTPAVNATIATWQASGVVGATTVSDITVPFFQRLNSYPRWALDKAKGSIAVPYFTKAGIPPAAYGGSSSTTWPNPADLDCCTDLFVMPHADPTWLTHQRLVSWNLDCKGGIWSACHAASALENMVNPADRTQQANFLTVKDPAWTGTTGNYALSNSLILWGSHSGGTPPYRYRLPADPISQFMGVLDGALLSGSEQIYMPRQGNVANASTYSASAVSRWHPGVRVLVFDPTQANVTNPDTVGFSNVAAGVIYGRGYNDDNRGYVMYEAGHTHDGTAPANVAAIRAFFNFSFLSVNQNDIIPDISGIPDSINTGSPVSLSYVLPVGVNPANYTTTWTSNCGGTFSSTTTNPTTFTPPVVSGSTPCIITASIQDACGRVTADANAIQIQPCVLTINRTVTPPACFGGADGQIAMSITGSAGPFSWNWSRTSPAGTGSGSGTTITGLSAGVYSVTVSDGGSCTGTFTQNVSQPALLKAVPTVTNYLCFGQTGAVSLSVTGGTAPYTYSWMGEGGPFTTQNISGIVADTFSVTVTDNNGCTADTSATVSGPDSAIVLTTVPTQVSCNGGTNGGIDLSVSGGTPGYTYMWSNLPGSPDPQDQSGLVPGTYTVTVTDANGCTATQSQVITQPSALVLSVMKTDPTCEAISNPPNLSEDGAIDLTVSGGTSAYTYSWTGPNMFTAITQDITNLIPGMYQVTVTDANNCTAMIGTTLVPANPLPAKPQSISNN